MRTVALILAGLLGVVFAVSAFDKALTPAAGAAALNWLVPPGPVLRALIALAAGWEAFLALRLVRGPREGTVALACGTLLFYAALIVARGVEDGWRRPCHCFGSLWHLSLTAALLRNALLLLAGAATLVLLRVTGRRGPETFAPGAASC